MSSRVSKLIFPKPSAEDILADITAWVISKPLEEDFQEKLSHRKKVAKALRQLSRSGSITEDRLIQFMRSDSEAVNVIISILGMSQEEFYRIVTLTRVLEGSYNSEWKIKTIVNAIRKDDAFAKRLANLFLEGRQNKDLAKRVPKFALDKLDRKKLLFDPDDLTDSLIKTGLKGAYDRAKGEEAEKLVAALLDGLKVPYVRKGNVPKIGRNMDFVIPSLKDPRILIEVGVYQTTARELSEKALVEMRIRTQVEDAYPDSVLVRITDGIGWLVRGGKALAGVIDASHYVLTLNQIGKLRDIVKAHVPKE